MYQAQLSESKLRLSILIQKRNEQYAMHHIAARSAFVSGEDAWVAGHELNKEGELIPTLRKNGALTTLPGDSSKAVINSVFVKQKQVK